MSQPHGGNTAAADAVQSYWETIDSGGTVQTVQSVWVEPGSNNDDPSIWDDGTGGAWVLSDVTGDGAGSGAGGDIVDAEWWED
jgi:hypothetical protein